MDSENTKMLLVKKIKIKTTSEQVKYLDFCGEQLRLLYNFVLSEKLDYYKATGNYYGLYDHKKTLVEKKKLYPVYQQIYNKCLQEIYFRVDTAFKRFFANKSIGFPKFKRKGEFVSLEYPGCYIKKISNNQFILPAGRGTDNLKIETTEKIPDKYKTVTIAKNKNSYFACFIVEEQDKEFVDNGRILAIDLGVKKLATGIDSQGNQIIIPKFKYYTKHLDELRSSRDRKVKGSNKHRKINQKYWKCLNKYKNRNLDYFHKATKYLTTDCDYAIIIVGDLNLENMKTSQSWFNRIIQNEWKIGKFVELLKYKSQKEGKKLVKVNEAYTSKTCYKCNNINHNLTLSDRTYSCSCGNIIDRDLNAAINIMKKHCKARAGSLTTEVANIATNLSENNYGKFTFKHR